MAQTIQVRLFDEIDCDRLIALHSSYYSEEHPARSRDYLEWLHLRNPFGKGLVTAALDDAEAFIGAMGAIPFRIELGSDAVTAYSVVNVLVHPLHRTKNLFIKMIRALSNALAGRDAWMVGHPNDAAYPGWKRAKMSFKPGCRLAVLRPSLSGGPGPGALLTIRSGEPLPRLDFDGLRRWRREVGEPAIAADGDYLKWRFLEHPIYDYCLRLRTVGDGVLGYEASRRFKVLARLTVDWQGDEPWTRGGIGRRLMPRLIAWPCELKGNAASRARELIGLPGPLRRRYRFFASPCGNGHPAAAAADWAMVTLAISDFV